MSDDKLTPIELLPDNRDCPQFGKALPQGMRCPPCVLAVRCFELLNSKSTSEHEQQEIDPYENRMVL